MIIIIDIIKFIMVIDYVKYYYHLINM